MFVLGPVFNHSLSIDYGVDASYKYVLIVASCNSLEAGYDRGWPFSTYHSGRKYKDHCYMNRKTKRFLYCRPNWYIFLADGGGGSSPEEFSWVIFQQGMPSYRWNDVVYLYLVYFITTTSAVGSTDGCGSCSDFSSSVIRNVSVLMCVLHL